MPPKKGPAKAPGKAPATKAAGKVKAEKATAAAAADSTTAAAAEPLPDITVPEEQVVEHKDILEAEGDAAAATAANSQSPRQVGSQPPADLAPAPEEGSQPAEPDTANGPTGEEAVAEAVAIPSDLSQGNSPQELAGAQGGQTISATDQQATDSVASPLDVSEEAAAAAGPGEVFEPDSAAQVSDASRAAARWHFSGRHLETAAALARAYVCTQHSRANMHRASQRMCTGN